MDKPHGLEYSDDKKWFTYKMFESLEYGQSNSGMSNRIEHTKQ